MMPVEDAEARTEAARRRRRIGIVVTGLLLVLTAVWVYFDRDVRPRYSPPPAHYRSLTAEHLRAESDVTLSSATRGEP